MRHWITCLCLAWSVLWFGAIAPGHERGAVRVPGAAPAAGGESCCTRPGDAPDGDRQPGGDPSRCCAICYLSGAVDRPPEVATPPALVAAAVLAPPRTGARPGVLWPCRPFGGRAPPP